MSKTRIPHHLPHPQDHARQLADDLAHFDQMAADMAEIIYMEQTRAEDQRLQRVLDPVENLFYLDLGTGGMREMS